MRFSMIVFAIGATAALACGESRRPIGEECLRNEDCLSNVCAARECVPAPTLITGAVAPPYEPEPLIADDSDASAGHSAPPDASHEDE